MDRGVKPTNKKLANYTLPKKTDMVWIENDQSIWVVCKIEPRKKKHIENLVGGFNPFEKY